MKDLQRYDEKAITFVIFFFWVVVRLRVGSKKKKQNLFLRFVVTFIHKKLKREKKTSSDPSWIVSDCYKCKVFFFFFDECAGVKREAVEVDEAV